MQFGEGFLVPYGVNPDRVSFELPSPSTDEPSVQPLDAQHFGRKPEGRLAVVILVGSLVTLVGVLILSHLAVRKTDLPSCKADCAFVVDEIPQI